jgi:hypothetical protein
MEPETITVTDRPWLAELTAKYGESRIPPGPVPLRGECGNYVRECWVWFPDGKNHNLAIDHYAGHWEIRARAPHTRVQADYYRMQAPSDAEVQSVLVLAGMLEATDAG